MIKYQYMLKIKLSPTGKKNARHYRIVVAEKKSKLTGRQVDILGHYHPLTPKTQPDRCVIDTQKLQHWLAQGAQPTARLRRLISARS